MCDFQARRARPPKVRYWKQSGNHMVDLGITGSDPKQTSAGMLAVRRNTAVFQDVIEYRANGIGCS